MSPRKYEMTQRAAAVEATRERIVAATVAAHRELGIQATSWEEIARRADVGVGTVYRHFRSIDELLPACGAVVSETLALPGQQEIERLFEGVRPLRKRVELLVATIFGVYGRGAPFIDNVRRERADLPALEPWHQQVEATFDALTREALAPVEPSETAVAVVRALTDLPTWSALGDRGLSGDEALETVARLVQCSLT